MYFREVIIEGYGDMLRQLKRLRYYDNHECEQRAHQHTTQR